MNALDELLQSLNSQQETELNSLITEGVVWLPTVGPQLDAYVSDADELFYGGSAGGGKTDLLCGLAIKEHNQSIIFRRELSQIGGIVERFTEIIGSRDGFNGSDYRWRLPNNKRLEFGGVRELGAEQKYQGRAHDLKAFDEITQFLEYQYSYLIAWNRSTNPDQRCRVVCTGNPPTTPEGEWVVQYWAPWLDPSHENPAAPGELRYFAVMNGKSIEVDRPEMIVIDGEEVIPRSRTFIPSSVDDNPFLARTGYKATLQGLPEPLRSKMLHGDFQAGIQDDEMQVIPTAWIDAAQDRWTESGGLKNPMSAVGADIARGGKDATVISTRHDNWFGELIVCPGAETPNGDAAASQIIKARQHFAPIHIDLTGVGTSPFDTLKTRKIQTIAFIAAAKSVARDQSKQLGFANKRAESWWLMRECLDPESGQDIQLPQDRMLRADLASARYSLTTQGILVEKKDDIIKRLGRSPDRGEAVILARYAFRKTDGVGTHQNFTADTDFEVL